MFVKWKKKWAAEVQRTGRRGRGRREGAGAAPGSGRRRRGRGGRGQLAATARVGTARALPTARGAGEGVKRAVEGPREPRRGRRAGSAGPPPSQAPLLNYL